jgi:hypothetical protein
MKREFYFAYGANMSSTVMSTIAPRAAGKGVAPLRTSARVYSQVEALEGRGCRRYQMPRASQCMELCTRLGLMSQGRAAAQVNGEASKTVHLTCADSR